MHSSEVWLDVMNNINASYSLLAIDLPGFGKSPPLEPGAETLENYTAVLLDFIERLTSSQQLLMIVGDSLGAIVILGALAVKQLPTKQIALSGCPSRGLPRWVCALTKRKLLTNSLSTLQKLPVSLSRRIISAATAVTFRNRAKVNDAVQQAAQSSDPRTAEVLLRKLCQREQSLIDFHNITAKNSQVHYLILRGEYDRLVSRESSRALARALKGRVEEIKGVGHTTMLEDPAGYAQAILAADLRADLSSAIDRSWG
jgi:pimeloyl-ACP methyl ester carboxylesterase